jgi:hypothetical protein
MLAGPPGEGRQGQQPQIDQEFITQLIAAFELPGRRPGGGGFGAPNFLSRLGIGGGGGFGGFGGGQNLVDEGDYLISMTVGGTTLSQVLRVEKAPTAP